MSAILRRTIATAAAGLVLAAGLGTHARPLELDDVAREGELRLLPERPDPEGYGYVSHVVIDEESLRDGVVRMHTCHQRLDPNPRIVVLFNRERVRSIDIVRTEGVARAWVDGHRVELAGVQRGGTVCIDVRSRALDPLGDGRWRLHAGPLMRRYLDGYLPMEAQLRVSWPSGLLGVTAVEPPLQPGVRLQTAVDGAHLNVIIAGRLSARWELQQRVPLDGAR